MIRNFESSVPKVVVTVILKDQRRWENCDIPSEPYASPGMFAFWGDEYSLIDVPISNIDMVIFHEKED